MIPFVNPPSVGGGGINQQQATQIATAARRQPVASIAALKALTPSAGDAVNVLGYAAAGDGGGGTFYYDAASVVADNGGTIIAPNAGAGRWLRAYSGAVNVKWFGAKGDGSTNDTAAIAAAAGSGSVFVPVGRYVISDCQIPTSGCDITCERGATFLVPRGATYAGMYFNGVSNYSPAVMATAVTTETGYQGQAISKIAGVFPGFVIGDICVISCDVKNTVGCAPGETFKVLEVGADYILAARMLVDAYSGNIYVRRATSVPKVRIVGATFAASGDTSQAGAKSVLLRLRCANYYEIECNFGDAWNMACQIEGGYRGRIRASFSGLWVQYGIDAYGYVVNITGATYCPDIVVSGDKAGHVFVSGASESNYIDGSWYNYGIPYGHFVHDSLASNTRRAPFDEHFGYFGRFENCRVDASKLDDEQNSTQNFGFAISGFNTSIIGCYVRDARGFLVTGSKNYGARNYLQIINPTYIAAQTASTAGIARYDATVPALMTIMVMGGYVQTSGEGYADGYAGRTVISGTAFIGCTRMFRLYSASSELTLLNVMYHPDAASNDSVGRCDLSSQVLKVDGLHVATPSEISYVADFVQAGTTFRLGRVTCPTTLSQYTGQVPVTTNLVTATS